MNSSFEGVSERDQRSDSSDIPTTAIRSIAILRRQRRSCRTLSARQIRDLCRHNQLHLTTRAGPIPDLKLRHHISGTLKHAGEPPVTDGTARIQCFRGYSLTIISNTEANPSLMESDFQLDGRSVGQSFESLKSKSPRNLSKQRFEGGLGIRWQECYKRTKAVPARRQRRPFYKPSCPEPSTPVHILNRLDSRC